ncbi:ParB/RepB/Spo0J family partition protein [Paraburkholderia caledonica]
MNMKSFADKAAGIRLTTEELAKAGQRPPTPPRTAPGQLMHLQATSEKLQDENDELKRQLAEARQSGSAIEIPLEQLHEVPGRRRYMPPEKYIELRENLRHNDLIHPVVVLPRAEGGFEIWSGHHRTDAYRELARPTIWCVLGKATKASASAGAFYANLLQSDLTDYEKYIGFKEILSATPGLTQAEVAEQAGVPASVVSKLMSFEQLPEPVLALLKEQPSLLGSASGYALSTLTKEGKSERVVAAVARLAKGEIDQTQAVKLASADPAKPKASKAEAVKVRVGKALYCDMRIARNVVRMEFQSAEEASAVQAELKAVLEARAQRLKEATDASKK